MEKKIEKPYALCGKLAFLYSQETVFYCLNASVLITYIIVKKYLIWQQQVPLVEGYNIFDEYYVLCYNFNYKPKPLSAKLMSAKFFFF